MMKPFNREAAKAGDPVIHRTGTPARIICFERADTKRPLVVLSTDEDSVEHVLTFREDGKYCAGGESSPYDLFMAPVKREGWANLYPIDRPHSMARNGVVYESEKLANECAQSDRIACIHLEWEE